MKKIFLCLFLMLMFIEVFADEFSDKFQNKKWILEYYNEIIYKRDRNLLLNYIPKYENQKETLFQRTSLLDECDYWDDTNSDTSIIYLLFDAFEIRDVKQISENSFYLFIGNGFIDTEKYNKNLENGCDWRNKEIEIESFYFKFDGDYLYIFLNDIDNLLTTYCAYDDDEYAGLIRFLQTNNFSNNIISLPRHADGMCDYDDIATAASENQGMEEAANAPATERAESVEETAIPKLAPAMGKTAIVTENLRLRTDDKTAAEVVTTLAAGTRVKVLALGKAETIDGIISNWVQVRVLDGAKDKDGNAVEAGTKGWLFGGYLSEAEEVATAPTKQNAALPILPIVAGVAAFAVLLAVVLFAVKKRKARKE